MFSTAKASLLLALFTALIFSLARPASAQYAASPLTQLAMHSDQGDYIGQGLNYLFNANDGSFAPTVQTNSAGKVADVTINFAQGDGGEYWTVEFSSQGLGTELTPGTYNQAMRAPFVYNGYPGLSVSGDSRGSNTLTGKFTVTEAVYDYSASPPRLASFAASWEQHSEGGSPALTGTIYWHSNTHPNVADTSHPDTTISVTAPVGKYGRYSGPAQITLAASDPDGAGDVAATYYTLDSGARQTYTGPFMVADEGMHALRYYSIDQTGNQETSKLRTVWIDTSPQTTAPAVSRLIMHSQPGDYIGGGKDYLYNDSDGQFTATANAYTYGSQTNPPVSTVDVSFHTPGYSHNTDLTFSTQQLGLPIMVGGYENAQRAAFTATGHPGMDISNDGAGSNTLTGKFTILDLVLDYSTSATQPQVVSFAATFEQHSEGAAPALFGTIYYHSSAYAGTPASVTFSPPLVLNGQPATGTVTLATPAPAGGEVVTLSSSNPAITGLPATVTVPAQATSASFAVTTTAVTAQTDVAVSAFAQGVAATGMLTVSPMSAWTAVSVASGQDGQTRVLWSRSDGAMTLWTLASDGSLATHTDIFGPYAGWTAKGISVGPDNNSHVLWDNADGRMTPWTLTSAGQFVGTFPTYGPYAGWTAQAIATGTNGNTHILWDNADGRMTPWTLDAQGQQMGSFPTFGPYTGWTAQSISAAPDGSTHVLWDNTDGRMTPWTLDASNQFVGSFPTYGPYTGWTAMGIASGPDGNTHILWDNSDGRITPWTLSASSQQVGTFPTYGPYSGWTAQGISVGQGSAHILWGNTDGRMTPWTLDSSSKQVGSFPTFGPF